MRAALDYLIEKYLEIRWDKIKSTAFFVCLFGLGLIGLNFWDIAWRFLFEPAGFNRDAHLPAIFGLILVFLGLATLLLDKFIPENRSATFQQDRSIFNRAREIITEQQIDSTINNMHYGYYFIQQARRLDEFIYFLEDGSHYFTNKKLQEAVQLVVRTGNELRSHMGMHFTGPNHVGSETIEWHYKGHKDYGSPAWEEQTKYSKELKLLCSEFEDAHKKFIQQGNKLGMVNVD